MRELVEVLAQSLVDHPEEVTVQETEKDNEILLELKVAQEDMGKVIGKQGRIAKAIRAVVKAAASKTDKRLSWKLVSKLTVYACSLCYGRLFLYRKLLTMWCYATKNCFSNSCKAKCWLCFFIGG